MALLRGVPSVSKRSCEPVSIMRIADGMQVSYDSCPRILLPLFFVLIPLFLLAMAVESTVRFCSTRGRGNEAPCIRQGRAYER